MNTSATSKQERPAPVRVQPVVMRQFDGVTLYNADCLEILPELVADAVVADPPYGIRNESKGPQPSNGRKLHYPGPPGTMIGRFRGKIIGDDQPFDPSPWIKWPCVLWGAGYYHERLPRGGWLIWDKKCDAGYEKWNNGDGDMAWISRKGAPRIFRLIWMGLVRGAGELEKDKRGRNLPSWHPNQKPVGLMQWSMDQLKVPTGATVLDPYMGSGTTGLACIRTGRKFIGVEKDKRHFETACERIERELAQGVLLPHNTQDHV